MSNSRGKVAARCIFATLVGLSFFGTARNALASEKVSEAALAVQKSSNGIRLAGPFASRCPNNLGEEPNNPGCAEAHCALLRDGNYVGYYADDMNWPYYACKFAITTGPCYNDKNVLCAWRWLYTGSTCDPNDKLTLHPFEIIAQGCDGTTPSATNPDW